MMEKPVYCCERMRGFFLYGQQGNHNRLFTLYIREEKFYIDMSDGEYGSMEVSHCPFCGKKLELAGLK